jgi:preprotein translocase subunit SecB
MATDQAPTPEAPAPEAPAQQFSIQKIYLRDVSFENPNAPLIYSGTSWEPKMNLGIESSSRKLGEEQYEVVLKVTIEAKIEDKTAYLIEVHQAGLFSARGFDEAALGPLLGSFCPNILYPYAREEVTSLAAKGGFPQLLIEPINFDALYAQSQEQAPTTANA